MIFVGIQDFRKPYDHFSLRNDLSPQYGMPACEIRISRAEACPCNLEELATARLGADQCFDNYIIRISLAQRVRVMPRRFYMNAPPALCMECVTDRVRDWVMCADVYVKPAFDILECTPQDDIFEILCV